MEGDKEGRGDNFYFQALNCSLLTPELSEVPHHGVIILMAGDDAPDGFNFL